MKFSLNGFKKVSREGNTTTLQHPSGHELVINHSTLSPKLRGEIEALPHISEKHPDTVKPKPSSPKFAEGGETKRQIPTRDESDPTPEEKEEYDENMKKFAEQDKESDHQPERELASEPKKYAEGGETDNGPQAADKRVEQQNSDRESKEQADKAAIASQNKADYEAYKAKQPETEDTRPGRNNIDDVIAAHKNLTDSHNAIVQALAGSQPSAQPQSPTPEQQPDYLYSGKDNPTPPAQPSSTQQPQSPQGQTVMPVTPEDKAAAGLPMTNQPQAPEQPTTQQLPPGQPQLPGSATPSGYQGDINAAQKGISDLASYTADHEAKNQQLFDAVSQGKVDPKRYFSNLDTAGKIANVIGLIMGGLGANATGGRNLAVDAMNHLIEQDVDAQKANTAQGTNLYKLNLEKTKNEQEARSMTINQQLTMAQAVLAKQAAGTTNASALANIQKTNEEIKGLKLQNDMSAYKAKILNETGSGNGQPGEVDTHRLNALIMSGAIPKEQATAATKELQNYQEGQKLKQSMEESAKHLDNQIGAGAFTPSDRKSAINAFAGRIAKIAEGRFNLEESKLQAQALLPDTGDLPSTVRNKTQRRLEFFDSLTPTSTLETIGVKKPGNVSPIKTLNGVPYRLGPDNQYHRVR